ncbi:MAG: MBOAT family protein [Bacteroidetes bacterium]|nr:MAG: MBOAT family protein [Bacteroidota bacterium]
MLFNSPQFFLLLFVTLFLYYLPALRKLQIYTLIGAGFVFYGSHKPILVLLLLTSIALNIITSYQIATQKNRATQRLYATVGVVLNLALLAFFKYAGMLSLTFLPKESPVVNFLTSIPLPIGISFFTFQGISLVVDTFKSQDNSLFRNIKPTSHTVETTLFIAFFPHAIAGPIVKAHDFYPQIKTKFFREIPFEPAFKALVIGFFLKTVLADNLKDETFWISFPQFQGLSSLNLIFLLIGYSSQIFADFAGYSLIAIGVARLFGYELTQNFNFPYISRSFAEFWQRWHISLSSFLREYLYIPLGGNRKGKFRTYLNLMIVMGLGGLWHGAAWSYLVWGMFHGVALAIERLLDDALKVKIRHWSLQMLQICFVYTAVTLAWLLFKLPEFSQVIAYFIAIAHNAHKAVDYQKINVVVFYSLFVLFYHLYYLFISKYPQSKVRQIEPYLYGVCLFLIITNSGSTGEFIYFQF